MYSKLSNIINNGITIFNVAGLIKKPKKVKLSNIKSKNTVIEFFKVSGKSGKLIQPNKKSQSQYKKLRVAFHIVPNSSVKPLIKFIT